jgi:hypothetical protein
MVILISDSDTIKPKSSPSISPFSKAFRFTLPELILIALMSAANVGFDVIVSPALILIFSHIVTGMLIMVPVNFIFMVITKLMVKKYGSLTLYLVIFGLISIPTTLFGGQPGIYKVLIGLALGLLLDLCYVPEKIPVKLILGSILGSIVWWIITFSVWQGFGFVFVKGFSQMLNAAAPVYNGQINFNSFVTLPITGFGPDFFKFCVLCGLLSAGPVFIANLGAYFTYKKIARTTVFARFQQVQ